MFLKEAAKREEAEVGGELEDPVGDADEDETFDVEVTVVGRLDGVVDGYAG